MQLNVNYDASVAQAPAGFVGAINAVVQYLDNEFTNPVTITIDVGYGECNGQLLAANEGALSFTPANSDVEEDYATVRNILISEGAPGASTLPVSSPDPGALFLHAAEAKALGLLPSDNSVDGFVGFSSLPNVFSFANGATPPANEEYFIGTAEHEITELMGRVSLLDQQPNFYAPIDLFRYSSPGERDLSTGGVGSTAYFSVDNGATDLGTWNNDPNLGDLADWLGSNIPNGGDDAFTLISPFGALNIVSQADITAMQALGWTTASSPPPPPPPPPSPVTATDLLWRNSNGALAEWLMNGAAIVSSATPTFNGSAVAPDPSWSIAGIGDFNDSGNSSILWQQGSTGSLAMWLMNGATITSGAAPMFNGSAVSPGSSWGVAGIGDFNGDGNDDILWRQNGGALAEWLMNGATITSSAVPTFNGTAVSPDPSWSVAGIGDFDGNGNADILWRQSSTGALAEWLMNGRAIGSSAAITSQGSAVAPDSSWSIAGVGDFNGDGNADVLWRQSSTGSLAIWLMNGPAVASSAPVTSGGSAVAPDATWNVVQIGDFGGSNQSGILWQQSTTGALVEWQMNGSQIVSSQIVTSGGSAVAPPSSWHVQARPTDFV